MVTIGISEYKNVVSLGPALKRSDHTSGFNKQKKNFSLTISTFHLPKKVC